MRAAAVGSSAAATIAGGSTPLRQAAAFTAATAASVASTPAIAALIRAARALPAAAALAEASARDAATSVRVGRLGTDRQIEFRLHCRVGGRQIALFGLGCHVDNLVGGHGYCAGGLDGRVGILNPITGVGTAFDGGRVGSEAGNHLGSMDRRRAAWRAVATATAFAGRRLRRPCSAAFIASAPWPCLFTGRLVAGHAPPGRGRGNQLLPRPLRPPRSAVNFMASGPPCRRSASAAGAAGRHRVRRRRRPPRS